MNTFVNEALVSPMYMSSRYLAYPETSFLDQVSEELRPSLRNRYFNLSFTTELLLSLIIKTYRVLWETFSTSLLFLDCLVLSAQLTGPCFSKQPKSKIFLGFWGHAGTDWDTDSPLCRINPASVETGGNCGRGVG